MLDMIGQLYRIAKLVGIVAAATCTAAASNCGARRSSAASQNPSIARAKAAHDRDIVKADGTGLVKGSRDHC